MNIKAIEYVVPETHKKRFCIVSMETGEILDDAQGYGYRTAQGAHKAYSYKNRDKSKDAEKEAKRNHIREWMKEHKSFVRALNDIAFRIQKGSFGSDDKVDAELVQEILQEYDLHPGFSASELLRVWKG